MTTSRTDDLHIASISKLSPPSELLDALPLSDAAASTVAAARSQALEILTGKDDRLLVVVGPCSIHDTSAALEYAQRLKNTIARHQDDLQIIMRVYFEKPRTTVGWKGLINDPHLDDSYDINTGLRVARELLITLADQGIPAGTEFLDTISPQFYADCISWGAIGARTTESQIHRELASGLSMPVGFKNGTGGGLQIAVDAIGASSKAHRFLSVTKDGTAAIVETTGNDCHIILRGGKNGTNYDEISISETTTLLEKAGLPPYVMVDCSHGNSKKDFRNQPLVADELARQIASGSTAITSVMLESHLLEGNQSLSKDLVYGQSITDACMSWQSTVDVLEVLAEAVRKRRTA